VIFPSLRAAESAATGQWNPWAIINPPARPPGAAAAAPPPAVPDAPVRAVTEPCCERGTYTMCVHQDILDFEPPEEEEEPLW
jgi:hypothetical protein